MKEEFNYITFMRVDYEGAAEDSIRLFKKDTDAVNYINELKIKNGTDYYSYVVMKLKVD
jgi:hypothetical protein